MSETEKGNSALTGIVLRFQKLSDYQQKVNMICTLCRKNFCSIYTTSKIFPSSTVY